MEKAVKELLKDIYRTLSPYEVWKNDSKIEEKTILYESFFGRNISCGPLAIFAALLKRPEGMDYHHVFVISKDGNARDAKNRILMLYPESARFNMSFVSYKSNEYYDALAHAKYLINNSTFPESFIKKPGQVYLNTWHGIPLKHMGYDMPDGPVGAANTVRNFLQADYLLSPCEHHSQMYQKAYRMKGLYDGKILECGQARSDLLFYKEKKAVIAQLVDNGVVIDAKKKLVLYAPTWKGTNFSNPSDDRIQYQEIHDRLEKELGNDYEVLVKPHQAVYEQIKKTGGRMDYLVPSSIDANLLLSITDLLISDYSSIFFDFLVTGKPVLFYIPDLKEYQENRGLYLPVDKLPGPATDKPEDLVSWILNLDETKEKWKDAYEEMKAWACPYDDGQVSNRIIDKIFYERGLSKGKVIEKDHQKERLLFFLGGLRGHGITSSMLGLLKQLKLEGFYNKHDVSLYIYPPADESEWERLGQIPKEVRVICHTKAPLGSAKATAEFLVGKKERTLKKVGQKQAKRMFGNSSFDQVVDFVGYSPLFSAIGAFMPAKDRYIWLHNDMIADKNREVNGKKVNEKRLDRVFLTYPYFDRLVSCSHTVSQVNADQLAKPMGIAKERFVGLSNMVNLERIREDLKDYDPKEGVEVEDLVTQKTYRVAGEKESFATMGRLSTEKNHRTLYQAFARYKSQGGLGKLYVLGDGPLREEEIQKVKDLSMEGEIILCGNLAHPFPLLKGVGSFVLPSLHEGQPMVVLEARVLGMKIILSNFKTVTDVLEKKGQILVNTDEESIYQGLLESQKEEFQAQAFDGEKYNHQVYQEFLRIFHFE